MKTFLFLRKVFPPVFTFLIIILFSGCQSGSKSIDSGFEEPANPDSLDRNTWNMIQPGLQGSFGSTNIRYKRNVPPEINRTNSWEVTAWQGEGVSAQLVLWSMDDITNVRPVVSNLSDPDGNKIGSSAIQIRPVRYVLTDEFLSGCGYRSADTIPVHLVADMLDTLSLFNIPEQSVRPLWITVAVPPDTKPGEYSGTISIESSKDGTLQFTISLEVQDWLLPAPSEWSFHLDLWQNPFAVARFHNVELWSQDHLNLLKPLLTMLADAGQKCITTSIVDKPWGGQTYDPFESMITWIKNSDGRWEFDYHVFDLFVSFAMECGITRQINCYSMVPWGNKIMYLDEDSAKFVTIEEKPGTDEYEDLWRPFLYDFRAHLMEMGWLDITTIALDERGLKEMKKMFHFLKQTAPEFRITMAGHYFEEINPEIYDFSYNWRHIQKNSNEIAKSRRKEGLITTYYVACGIPDPNNFTFSPPAESTFEGWFAAAMGFDGFLRWAYNSWVEDPLKDSRFRTWPAGDTYFVYPGSRSSIRFEKLKEGIQDYEKIRILNSTLIESANPEMSRSLVELNDFLKSLSDYAETRTSTIEKIIEGKALIVKISNQ